MDNLFLLWMLGAFTTASCLMWWFNTNLPIHVAQLCSRIVPKKDFWIDYQEIGDESFPVEVDDWTKANFDNFLATKTNELVAELYMCKGCISLHIAFYIAVVMYLVSNPPIDFLLWSIVSWPSAGNMILKLLK